MIEISGLEKLLDADGNLPEKVQVALMRAINRTADSTRTKAARAVLDQVAFPASYVSPAAKKLWVQRRARQTDLQAVIEGRGEATSMRQFAKNKEPIADWRRQRKSPGVAVRVTPGGAYHTLPRAFIIKLKNGNRGLAIRTDGSRPLNSYKPREIGKNLWLLYGPSVDQALLAASDGDGVYEDLSPDALDFMVAEFNRQLDVLGVSDA